VTPGAVSAPPAGSAREPAAPAGGPPAVRGLEGPVTPELVAEHGLLPEEYERIVGLLGRPPNVTELGVFSVLWSEHCAYKNSRALLRRLPQRGAAVLQGPGENAGVVDLGGGWAAALKIESHNHPSAVEPYQGAATGVGGILRDVFTMGARPVAILDSLRFGPITGDGPAERRNRYLVDGVVRGVGDYGNCVGVPTVGGETVFASCYSGNPLVNAMAVGLLRTGDLVRARAGAPGSPVLAVGASTGRDGIHGCSLLASTELDEASLENRPTVQVGDPFTEKLLLEATLEIAASGAAAGIQDMGAAGLSSSSAEMASRAGAGIEIDVGLLHLREPGMTPYEILLSESQERMLVVAHAGRADEVRAICEKWELPCAQIGRVTDDGRWRVLLDGETVCDVPVRALVDEAPVYRREAVEPPSAARLRRAAPPAAPLPAPADALRGLLALPNVASKRWIWRQYDSTVRASTVAGPGGDAAVVRIPGTARGIAMTVDGNARLVVLNPRRGAALAVAEAVRNLACVGARPLAVTDCLNFGNPYNPEVSYQFAEAIEGLREACEAFGLPVVSGNVSFYNEGPGGPVWPTPVVGLLGVVEDVAGLPGSRFHREGDAVLLVGPEARDTAGSEYEHGLLGTLRGDAPPLDLDLERRVHEVVRALVAERLARSAHDCAEGGLAVALAECCFDDGGAFGLDAPDGPADAGALFGEAPSRVIVSCAPADAGAVLARCASAAVPARRLGSVGPRGGRFRLGAAIDLPAPELAALWEDAIPALMEGPPAAGRGPSPPAASRSNPPPEGAA
jgi:phosphoribosylformylglycinamidine synthase